MNHHEKGMRLAKKAREVEANNPHARRLVRRMLRVWARGHDINGAHSHARATRHNARYI